MARAISPICAQGQKTGWYYDQRDNRAFIAALATGKTVLDAYSYTGGFGILAAKAGAKEVVCLDSSAACAGAGRRKRARQLASRSKPVKADVFEELERLMAAEGDVSTSCVADPPPFVKSKKDLEPGAKAYRKLARLAAGVTAPGGILLLASCSHNIPAERFAAECAAGNSAQRPAGCADPPGGRGAGSSGASDAAGKRVSKGVGLRAGLGS